ncbi:MAG: molybdopterin biosynthesis protein [Halobacteriales archaeon]
MRKQFRELASLAAVRDLLDDLAPTPDRATVALEAAVDRVVASTVRSPIDVPGFDRSIMDGYAVRATDTEGAYDDDPVALHLAGRVGAGEPPDASLEACEAVEIATGAVIPDGANAVVMVERTRRDGDAVLVERPVAPGENVMTAGADIPAGTAIVRRGDRLDPRRIGLLAAVGVDEVAVLERPRVGVVSTGREIVRPDERDRLGPAEIFDTNSYALAGAVADAGGEPRIHPHAGEAYDDIRSTLAAAADDADLVLSTGSTSASAEDVVYRVIEDAGELLLHGVALKPGKPTAIGRVDGTPVLGLPGNPISALMTFRLFGAPLVRRAAGRSEATDPTVEATLAATVESAGGRTQLLPVGLVESPTRGLLAYSVDKGSGAITSLGDADGYVTIPEGVHYRERDEAVEVTLLGREVTPPAVLLGGEFCAVVDGLVDDQAHRVRLLTGGALDGITRVRDGILDAAVVDVPDDILDRRGVSDAVRVRGYDRHLALAIGPDGPTGDPEAILDGVDVVAAPPRGTGVRWHLEQLLGDRSIRVADRPSYTGVAAAVTAGDASVGFLPEYHAVDRGLAVERVLTEPVDVLVADDRRAKPAVEAVVEAVVAADLDAVTGYAPAPAAGSDVASW